MKEASRLAQKGLASATPPTVENMVAGVVVPVRKTVMAHFGYEAWTVVEELIPETLTSWPPAWHHCVKEPFCATAASGWTRTCSSHSLANWAFTSPPPMRRPSLAGAPPHSFLVCVCM